jgi:hypothetical protein
MKTAGHAQTPKPSFIAGLFEFVLTCLAPALLFWIGKGGPFVIAFAGIGVLALVALWLTTSKRD